MINRSKTFVRDSWGNEDYMWVVQCDSCGSPSTKLGIDPGVAAEKARREGFVTVASKVPEEPRQWLCPACKAKSK